MDYDPRYQHDADGNRSGTTPYGEQEFAPRRSAGPAVYATSLGPTGRAIIAELTAGKSLLVWALLGAVLYFTPLLKAALFGTGGWSPVLGYVAEILVAFTIAWTSPTARKVASGCLVILVLMAAGHVWLFRGYYSALVQGRPSQPAQHGQLPRQTPKPKRP
jgi:hypothetical protein